MERMRFEDHITVTPGVRSGKPCIRGTRITVADILEYLAGGMTGAEILDDFPDLRSEHIRAVLAFAAAREHRLRVEDQVAVSPPSTSSARREMPR
jgi:uncharacterized protein (DUF433 family)